MVFVGGVFAWTAAFRGLTRRFKKINAQDPAAEKTGIVAGAIINKAPTRTEIASGALLAFVNQKGFDLGRAVVDGDCFFDAVAQILSEKEKRKLSIKDVRVAVDDYLKNSKDSENYDDLNDNVRFTVEECNQSGKALVWGDNTVMKILSKVYNISFTVYEIHMAEIGPLEGLRLFGEGKAFSYISQGLLSWRLYSGTNGPLYAFVSEIRGKLTRIANA